MPNSFIPLLQWRLPKSNDFRDTMMARRWTQKEGLAMGLLDEVVDGEQLMQRATEVALREAPKCAPGPWGFIKVSKDPRSANARYNLTGPISKQVSRTSRSFSPTWRPRRSGTGMAVPSCDVYQDMHMW